MAKRTFENEEQLKDFMKDQSTKLGELYSQCWESEDFKKKLIADPKAVFDEYGIEYEDEREYRVIDSAEKTIVQILPYEDVKLGVENFTSKLLKTVEDLQPTDSKQILLEGWKWEIYQNTEDVYYLAIPVSPENLTPEELEMVNGGCIIAAIFFLFGVFAATVVTDAAAVTEAVLFAILAVAAAAIADVALKVAGAVIEVALLGTTAVVASQYVSAANHVTHGG